MQHIQTNTELIKARHQNMSFSGEQKQKRTKQIDQFLTRAFVCQNHCRKVIKHVDAMYTPHTNKCTEGLELFIKYN